MYDEVVETLNSPTLVIVPTYNECENIEKLIRSIFESSTGVDLLVVDDNSPDGTAQIVAGLKAQFKNLYVLKRTCGKGFSKSYLDGFQWGLGKNFQFFIHQLKDQQFL